MAKTAKEDFREKLMIEKSKLENEVTEEKLIDESKEEEKKEEVAKEKGYLDLVIEKGFVTKEQISEWKDVYGKVFVTVIDQEDEVYIYRPITRIEWMAIDRQVAQSKSPNKNDYMDGLIVQKCMLYPSFTEDWKATVSAGTFSMVSTQVQMISNFLPQAVISDLIQRI